MTDWPDLDRDRWRWAELAEQELLGLSKLGGHPDDVSGTPHVMLVGDTQVGKTTLMLWLLGVTGSEEMKNAQAVLRGGRPAGRSATAAPVRYTWSDEKDRWRLSSCSESLAGCELKERLAAQRSGDGIVWRPGDPPVEIGIPRCLASTHPVELRILDTPGLYAEDEHEQETARELLTRSAPGMTAIVIVQRANRVAEAMMDPAITGNPYLSAWSRDPARYRLVLSSAFSDHSTREALLNEREKSAEALADQAVQLIAEQVAGTFTPTGDPEVLRRILYPVDLGRSLNGMRQRPDLAPLVAASEVLLERLRDSLRVTASEDGRYLSASDLPARIARIIEERALGRRERQAERSAQVDSAQQRTESARQQAESARGLLEDAREKRRRFTAALDEFGQRSVTADRPKPPVMSGKEVRIHQAEEEDTLARAAEEHWAKWTGPATPFPADIKVITSGKYRDGIVCCGKCAWWRLEQDPAWCYAKMGEAWSKTLAWIQQELPKRMESLDEAIGVRLARADYASHDASAYLGRCEEIAAAAAAELARSEAEAALEEEEERLYAEVAETALAVHDSHNRAYVMDLVDRAGSAAPADKAFLLVAALRALYDLDTMYQRRSSPA